MLLNEWIVADFTLLELVHRDMGKHHEGFNLQVSHMVHDVVAPAVSISTRSLVRNLGPCLDNGTTYQKMLPVSPSLLIHHLLRWQSDWGLQSLSNGECCDILVNIKLHRSLYLFPIS